MNLALHLPVETFLATLGRHRNIRGVKPFAFVIVQGDRAAHRFTPSAFGELDTGSLDAESDGRYGNFLPRYLVLPLVFLEHGDGRDGIGQLGDMGGVNRAMVMGLQISRDLSGGPLGVTFRNDFRESRRGGQEDFRAVFERAIRVASFVGLIQITFDAYRPIRRFVMLGSLSFSRGQFRTGNRHWCAVGVEFP